MLKLIARSTLIIVALSLFFAGCRVTDPSPEPLPDSTTTAHKLKNIYDGGFVPGNGTFFYTSGASGTVTVPAGAYVTGVMCHATASSATLQMTPAGPSITDAQVGPLIPIPTGGALNLTRPLLQGNPNELGVGSVLVFTNTDSYMATFFQYGGP